MMARFLLPLLLLAHLALLPVFAGYMAGRPVEVKLGYVPHPQMLKLTTADHQLAVAEMAVVKVLFYFGTVVQKFNENVVIRPERANMYRTLSTAVRLDPYNLDAYYFAQAAFTWEVGRVAEVNELLEWGAQHRTWDPWLPFYLGFNHAYFLKDYKAAASYMQRAAEISGNPLFARLAARYLYESDQVEFGLLFLETMIAQAKNQAVRQTYELRRDALLAIRTLEMAVVDYRRQKVQDPANLEDLVRSGVLTALPVDPYGGTFYLDEDGRVRTTSKLAPKRTD
jgi:tetratricopeptide (TPR) repeat protein